MAAAWRCDCAPDDALLPKDCLSLLPAEGLLAALCLLVGCAAALAEAASALELSGRLSRMTGLPTESPVY